MRKHIYITRATARALLLISKVHGRRERERAAQWPLQPKQRASVYYSSAGGRLRCTLPLAAPPRAPVPVVVVVEPRAKGRRPGGGEEQKVLPVKNGLWTNCGGSCARKGESAANCA